MERQGLTRFSHDILARSGETHEGRIIGLGVMGGPMALNILKGGHDLTVFDLNPEAVAQTWMQWLS